MRDFNNNTSNNDEWLTPPEIIEALGQFDLDPCAPHPDKRPWDMALNHYHERGLSQPWVGRVWCNPPYGKETFKWMEKLAAHGSGIALIFARTETKGFHREIWQKAHSVFFFEGRLRFYTADGKQGGTANAPSCLVSYSEADTAAIGEAVLKKQIRGKLIKLNKGNES